MCAPRTPTWGDAGSTLPQAGDRVEGATGSTYRAGLGGCGPREYSPFPPGRELQGEPSLSGPLAVELTVELFPADVDALCPRRMSEFVTGRTWSGIRRTR